MSYFTGFKKKNVKIVLVSDCCYIYPNTITALCHLCSKIANYRHDRCLLDPPNGSFCSDCPDAFLQVLSAFEHWRSHEEANIDAYLPKTSENLLKGRTGQIVDQSAKLELQEDMEEALIRSQAEEDQRGMETAV